MVRIPRFHRGGPGSIPGQGIFYVKPRSLKKNIKTILEAARSRTWNLLIRSQTRYPLRHNPLKMVVENSLINRFTVYIVIIKKC